MRVFTKMHLLAALYTVVRQRNLGDARYFIPDMCAGYYTAR